MADIDIQVADSLTLGEGGGFGVDPQVYVTESLTIVDAKTPTVRVGAPQIQLSDLIALTDQTPIIGFDLLRSLSDTLVFTEAISIEFTGQVDLAITDEEVMEVYDFIGVARSFAIEITDSPDTMSFTGVAPPRLRFRFEEPLSEISINAFVENIGNFAIEEFFEKPRFTGSPGIVANLGMVDPFDRQSISMTGVIPAVGSLAIEEPTETIWMHAEGVPYSLKTVVMNLKHYSVVEYKNFNFKSIVHFNGYYLGMNDEGIFILDGDDDLGQLIESRVKSGTEDFGKVQIAIPREAWLAYRSDTQENAIQLDIRVDEAKDLYPGRFGGNGNRLREHRTKLGRGIKARFFSWDLKNLGGSWFNIESLRILGDIITRKTR